MFVYVSFMSIAQHFKTNYDLKLNEIESLMSLELDDQMVLINGLIKAI